MRTLMFAVAFAATGCSLDMSGPDLDTATQNAEAQNRLAANRLAANRLAANRLAANRLAANSLSSTRLVALDETSAILNSISGREVYSYIVNCALSGGDGNTPATTISKNGVRNYCTEIPTMTDPPTAPTESCDFNGPPQPFPADDPHCTTVDGDNTTANCTFTGGLGLASDWATRRLGNAGKGWVSACLFARSNLYDTGVGISLRGEHAGLAVDEGEAESYTVQEGGFYGNVFTGDNKPIEWFACRGRDQAANTTDEGALDLRDCAEPDGNTGLTKCGFTYAGDCGDYTADAVADPHACRNADEFGNYTECAEGSRSVNWGGLDRYRQVITVNVSAD